MPPKKTSCTSQPPEPHGKNNDDFTPGQRRLTVRDLLTPGRTNSNAVQYVKETGFTILLVEQNAIIALKYASYGYVIEKGRTVLEGTTADLAANQDIQKFYLGVETH